jgi:hypothetical protein
MQQELESEFQTALEHLVMLAKNDGFKAHAWHRAKELDKQEHGMFRGIKDALLERMKQDKEQTA